MKANLRGLGGIKHFILAHGEKLGIVIIGAVAAMMIYNSLLAREAAGRKQADKLKQQVTMARKRSAASPGRIEGTVPGRCANHRATRPKRKRSCRSRIV